MKAKEAGDARKNPSGDGKNNWVMHRQFGWFGLRCFVSGYFSSLFCQQ